MANSVLSEKGWHLTETGIAEYLENGNKSIDAIIKMALDVDLSHIGQKFLPDDINRGKIDYIQGPCVLQIQKIRNVSAPKENEDSQAAPRLLKLSLTDGHCTCYGIELESINSVSLNTPPGSKVLFTGTIPVVNGFLQLNGKNTKGIGGRVEKLLENWELKRRLAKQHRAGIISEGGPPPFIPFGPRMTKSQLIRTDNFKSLEVSKEKKESEEFVNQRKATIAEAVQAKEGKIKTFGGNKQALNDKDVACLVEMGFVADQACQALRQNNGNVNQAIVSLLGKSGPVGRDGRGGNLTNSTGGQLKNTAKLGGEKPEKFHGREKKGRKNKEDKENGNEDVPSRPSGPATLFAYLESKIPIKEDSKSHTESKVSDSKRDVVYDNNKSDYDGRQNSDNRKSAGNRRNNLPPRLSGKANNSDSAPSNSNTNHSRPGHSNNYTSNNYSNNSYSGGHGYNNNDNSSGNTINSHSFNSGSNSGYIATSYSQDYNNSNHYQQRYNCNSSHGNYNNTLVSNNSANANPNYNNQRGYNKYENISNNTPVGNSNRSGGQDQNHVLNNNNPSSHYNHPHQQQRYNNHASVQGNPNNRAVFHQGYHSDPRQAGMVSTARQPRSYCHNQGPTQQQHTPYFNVSSGPTQQQQQQHHHPPQSPHYSNDVNARYPPYNQKDLHQHHQQPQQHNVSGSLGAENPNKIMSKDFQQQMFSPVAHNNQKMLDNLSMSEITDGDPRHVIRYDGSNGRNNYSYNTANRPKIGGSGSSGGNNCPKKHVDIDTSDFKHERKNNPSPNMVNLHSWRSGDHCLAKYWEDKKFYPAVIEYGVPDLPTCVVTFLEYGNVEEVMLTDVKPISKSWEKSGPAMVKKK